MVVNPYIDNSLDSDIRIREFSSDIDEMDLVWHMDRRDRIVEVLEGEGWKFQFEDDIPIELNIGTKIEVPKNHFHRVWKGTTGLKIKITEYGR
jgi:hypothetical protein